MELQVKAKTNSFISDQDNEVDHRDGSWMKINDKRELKDVTGRRKKQTLLFILWQI